MAFEYDFVTRLDLVRAQIVATLTAAGEAPSMVPYTDAIEQYTFDPSLLPSTVIEVDGLHADREQADDMSVYLQLHLTIYHARARVGTGNAGIVAIQRLAKLAADLDNDTHLAGAGATAGQVHRAQPGDLMMGEKSKIGLHLAAHDQSQVIAGASLALVVSWYEGLY